MSVPQRPAEPDYEALAWPGWDFNNWEAGRNLL